jgi:acetyl esterase/lipase
MKQAFGSSSSGILTPLSPGTLFRGLPFPNIQAKAVSFKSADGSDLSLDFYAPPRSTPVPLIIVIHGGSWNSGDNQDFIAMDRFLAGRGFAVVDVLYRLAPQFPFPAAVRDVQAALKFLRTRADSFGIDPDRIMLLGRSAGGQIALQVAYTANDPDIRGVISFYGPTDLFWSWENPGNPLVIDTRKVLADYLGGSPAEDRDNYANASPIRLATRSSPPTLLLHGGRDELVNPYHGSALSQRLSELGVPNLNIQLPWATHGFDYLTGGPGGQISAYAVESFARRTLLR